MHRVADANRHVNKFGVGKDGFRDGDKSLGVIATRPGAVSFDVLQEEVANAVEGAGLALSFPGGDYAQLREAIKRLGGFLDGARTGIFSRTSNAQITLAPVSGTKVKVEIDGILYEASSLVWDNTTDMDTGSVLANTVYYLYALVTGGALDTKISATAPITSGKVGYHPTRTSERCIFAMRTNSGSAVWEQFDEAPDGWTVLRSPISIALANSHNATYVTAVALTGVPATARAVMVNVLAAIDDLVLYYAHESKVGLTAASNPGVARIGQESGDRFGPGINFVLPVDSTPAITWGSESLGTPVFNFHNLHVVGWRNAL
jgi:hypothetical protein